MTDLTEEKAAVQDFWSRNINQFNQLKRTDVGARAFYEAAEELRLKYHYHLPPLFDHIAAQFPNGKLIEVGCSIGNDSIQLARRGLDVTGVDLMTRIDVKTGKVDSFEHPQHGDDKGAYPHTLRFDAAGSIWYTLTVSNHIARLDPRTVEFKYYDLPVPEVWDGPYPTIASESPWPIPVAYGLDVAPDQRIWFSQSL